MARVVEGDATSAKAEELVKKYGLGALVVGLMPLPLVDMVLLAAIQLRMLEGLADLYGVEFSRERSKSLIAALVGGGTSVLLSGDVARIVLRRISVHTWAANAISMSAFAGASTYAIGKVFIQHFESGGTFLTFDPDQVRDYYAEQFEKGKEQVKSFVGVRP